MRTSSLWRITLLSLINLSTQQSSSWGEPFTVDNSAITTPGASTENPIPQPTATSSWGQPFTVDNSATSLVPASTALSSQGGIQVDSVTPIPSSTARTSGGTLISGLQSQVSRDSTFDVSPTESTAASETASASDAAQSTGAAVVMNVVGYKKMGLAGAMAGAAGLILV